MNPKLVVVLVVAALLIGLMLGAGGGMVGTSMFYRLTERHDRYLDYSSPMAVPATAIAVVDEAVVEPNEPIPVLAPGQRAMTIKLGKEQAVQGFIVPGRKVDVAQTRIVPERQIRTETIAQDVQVLAVNRGGDETLLVTLSLTPEQVEDLAKAQNDGTLSLVLRR